MACTVIQRLQTDIRGVRAGRRAAMIAAGASARGGRPSLLNPPQTQEFACSNPSAPIRSFLFTQSYQRNRSPAPLAEALPNTIILAEFPPEHSAAFLPNLWGRNVAEGGL